MTDRYEKIRAALADMDAAAEARNALAWRDAHARFVVHVAPDTIHALLEERDALKAENEKLREALKDADNEMDLLDEDMDTCDHSVGVCMCSYWSMRRKMKAALARGEQK